MGDSRLVYNRTIDEHRAHKKVWDSKPADVKARLEEDRAKVKNLTSDIAKMQADHAFLHGRFEAMKRKINTSRGVRSDDEIFLLEDELQSHWTDCLLKKADIRCKEEELADVYTSGGYPPGEYLSGAYLFDTTVRDRLVTAKGSTSTDPAIINSFKTTPKDIRAKASFEASAAWLASSKAKGQFNPEYKALKKQIDEQSTIQDTLAKQSKALDILKAERSTKTRGTVIIDRKIATAEAAIRTTRKQVRNVKHLEQMLMSTPKYVKNVKVNYRKKSAQYSHIFIPQKSAKLVEMEQAGKTKPCYGIDVFPRFSNHLGAMNVREEFDIGADFIIRRHNFLDVWEIIISNKVERKNDHNSEGKLVSIDPGIRTFLTCIDSDGVVEEIGPGWSRILKPESDTRMKKYVDGVLVRKTSRERRAALIAKGQLKLQQRKQFNRIDDMHKKVTVHLLDKYDTIILPKLNTKGIVSKYDISRSTKRAASAIAHGRFHDYITHKARIRGKLVVNQDECFTTKCCYNCGNLTDIGACKTYTCTSCTFVCDRDVNSALNILTKFMGS